MKRIIILFLLVTITLGASAQRKKTAKQDSTIAGVGRFLEVMGMIDKEYVETPNTDELSEKAIVEMLRALDPHSVYISAENVEKANEGLKGNFEGVGVSFQIIKDTINVMDVIVGGPSEKVGIMQGDKILKVDDEVATGDSITTAWVPKRLRGPKGSHVKLEILRGKKVLTFDIKRDKVPLYSVDTYFMADDTIGYIRLTRFSRTSAEEVRKAINELTKQGMKALLFDLRGNSGGYLDIACALANEFLPRNSLIVYTQGRNSPRHNFKTNYRGSWREGKLVVLIDEGSASASEIVSGAVQDWDRGVLVGRRSFGKGLVQRMFSLKDGGQVRLTTARYYTPSGRCIQKPYDNASAYRNDMNERMKHGELVNVDSIHFNDSLRYTTSKGRIVYGGGGIMPDVFVPLDTMKLSDYFIEVRSKGLFTEWPLMWADQYREQYRKLGFDYFLKEYDSLNLDAQFEAYAAEQGVVRDTVAEAAQPERIEHSNRYQHLLLKASVAKDLFGTEYYYRVMKDADDGYAAGLRVLRGQD